MSTSCPWATRPPGARTRSAAASPTTASTGAGPATWRRGGLVAALVAVRALRRPRLRGDVLVACVAGEEDGGLGAYALLDRGWRADACVIPEPTGLDVVPANAGALTFRLRVRGRAAHA